MNELSSSPSLDPQLTYGLMNIRESDKSLTGSEMIFVNFAKEHSSLSERACEEALLEDPELSQTFFLAIKLIEVPQI